MIIITCIVFFLLDKEQIGAKRRKKIPHFSDYFGGGGGPPGMGGAGGGSGGGFGTLTPLGLLGSALWFTGPGTSQSNNQGEFLHLALNGSCNC